MYYMFHANWVMCYRFVGGYLTTPILGKLKREMGAKVIYKNKNLNFDEI